MLSPGMFSARTLLSRSFLYFPDIAAWAQPTYSLTKSIRNSPSSQTAPWTPPADTTGVLEASGSLSNHKQFHYQQQFQHWVSPWIHPNSSSHWTAHPSCKLLPNLIIPPAINTVVLVECFSLKCLCAHQRWSLYNNYSKKNFWKKNSFQNPPSFFI